MGDYGSTSGASLNRDKSIGTWLGLWAKKPYSFLGIDWAEKGIYYLCVEMVGLGPVMRQ